MLNDKQRAGQAHYLRTCARDACINQSPFKKREEDEDEEAHIHSPGSSLSFDGDLCHFRAKAVGSGTAYGDDVTFTTAGGVVVGDVNGDGVVNSLDMNQGGTALR